MSAPKQRLRAVHSRNVEGPTTDCRQSEHRHHQATGAGRAECLPTVQICYSVEWSKVSWYSLVSLVDTFRRQLYTNLFERRWSPSGAVVAFLWFWHRIRMS